MIIPMKQSVIDDIFIIITNTMTNNIINIIIANINIPNINIPNIIINEFHPWAFNFHLMDEIHPPTFHFHP